MKNLILSTLFTVLFTGCSVFAERERPEDTSLIRASWTKASLFVQWFTGGTTVCQLTALQDGDPAFEGVIDNYAVILTANGCVVAPVNALEGLGIKLNE